MISKHIGRRSFVKLSAACASLTSPLMGISQSMDANIKVAIDIATTEIRIGIIEKRHSVPLKLISYKSIQNNGMKLGLIEDTATVSRNIVACINLFEEPLRSKITDVVAALPGVKVAGKTNVAGFSQLATSLNLSKLNLQKVHLKNQMSGDAVLIDEEKKNGVLVVDLGAATTSLAYFINNSLLNAQTIPIAGDMVTSDIAMALRTTKIAAEKIKVDFSNLSATNQSLDFEFEVPRLDGLPSRKLKAVAIPQIIEPRIIEIFELIKVSQKEINKAYGPIKSIVLTGGTSLTPTIAKICSDICGLKTRLGEHRIPIDKSIEISGPRSSVLAGMLLSLS
jgi:cell division ATPase FtsA